jgi:ParB/RepB/Spo0J family partition protein
MARTIELQEIPLSKVRPNPLQPRQSFPREGLEQLAASIKVHGLLQPILVRPKDGGFQVACGERRLRATEMAGLKQIPAIVREMDDKTLRLCSIVENVQREDLTSEEREKAHHDLWKKHFEPDGMTQSAMATALGLADVTVRDYIAAYERRHELGLGRVTQITSYDLAETKELDTRSAKAVLAAKAKGTIETKDLRRLVPVLREAPREKRPAILHEVMKETKKAEDFKEEVAKEARAFGRGEIKATSVKMVKSADLNRVDRFKEARDQVRFWTVASIEIIENEKVRLKAVEYVQDTRDHCETLLRQLEKRNWYAKAR